MIIFGFFVQVSISDEHKKLSSGKYEVRLYDEEGYSMLRKAQRSGESVDSVKPVTSITFNHPVSNPLRKRNTMKNHCYYQFHTTRHQHELKENLIIWFNSGKGENVSILFVYFHKKITSTCNKMMMILMIIDHNENMLYSF